MSESDSKVAEHLPFVPPIVQPESDFFWQELRAHRLVLRHCEACDAPYFYPRDHCPRCLSSATRWIEASGRGRLYSFAIVHRAPSAIFEASVPYIVALVDLDEGPRVATNLLGVSPDPDAIEIGIPVEAVFDDVSDQWTLLRFRPAPP